MPISYHYGDLWERGASTIVVTVNCLGTPGAGQAREWARRCPALVPAYQEACHDGRMRPGRVMPLAGAYLLMATKDDWRHPSRIEWIEAGLRRLRFICNQRTFMTLAMGKPGCGLGGLSWDQVGPLVRTYLGDLDCQVRVYIQHGDREY